MTSILMKIELDREPVYGDNDKYIKTKIKSYEDKINRNFPDKKIPKENESYKCLLLIMLDSVLRVSKKYYPEALLEESEYKIKNTKMDNLINDVLDLSSSDNKTDNISDNETEFDNDEQFVETENSIPIALTYRNARPIIK